jgi:hypothetical protein
MAVAFRVKLQSVKVVPELINLDDISSAICCIKCKKVLFQQSTFVFYCTLGLSEWGSAAEHQMKYF